MSPYIIFAPPHRCLWKNRFDPPKTLFQQYRPKAVAAVMRPGGGYWGQSGRASFRPARLFVTRNEHWLCIAAMVF